MWIWLPNVTVELLTFSLLLSLFFFLFFLLLLCFCPSCRCTLSSWSFPGFPWFCWHLPSWPYGNWRKMVTSLSWFSSKVPGPKPGLSGSPVEKLNWNGQALGLHSGITAALCPCSTFEDICIYGLRVSILFGSHIKCQRRSFWWTMVGKEIQTLPVLLKISCIIWLRFQSEGFEKYKNYVFPSTMQYQPLTWHWDDLPLTKHFGESMGF